MRSGCGTRQTRAGQACLSHVFSLTLLRAMAAADGLVDKVLHQYDSPAAMCFYNTVMGGGAGNIHYGIFRHTTEVVFATPPAASRLQSPRNMCWAGARKSQCRHAHTPVPRGGRLRGSWDACAPPPPQHPKSPNLDPPPPPPPLIAPLGPPPQPTLPEPPPPSPSYTPPPPHSPSLNPPLRCPRPPPPPPKGPPANS